PIVKDIYGGINPIFESLRNSINEGERETKKEKAIDVMTSIVTSLNTMFSLLLSSKMEDAKTVRGFESIRNKILGTDNFGSFRQYILSFMESLSVLDPAQKVSYESNIRMINSLLSGQTEVVLGDPKLFKSLKNDTIAKVLNNFNDSIKDRENQMRKTNPKFINRYKEIADGLLKKAQDLQMIDRGGALGGKIVTPTGEYKAREYKRKQDDLINEIIRQKKEYERIKAGILKIPQTNTTTADPVCPPGQIYDKSLGKCVDAKKDPQPKPTPIPVKECTFPIKLNKKCTQVGMLQKKLMDLIPSAKTYLSKFGGEDKIYGKGTAAVSNIVWGYLSGKSGQSLTSDLAEDMYDSIMALTENDVDVTSIIIEK
ncbi:MAG: hypothetical protein EBS19_15775, partial [Spirochaetia bacterium]|nr:hypothetical protein [Spirochaetia bacterium]